MPVVGDVAEACNAILQCSVDGETVTQILETMFELPGTDLDKCSPSGWTELPTAVLQKIACPETRQFAIDVHALWPDLCRKVHVREFLSVLMPCF